MYWVIAVTSMCRCDDNITIGDKVSVIRTPVGDQCNHGEGYELVRVGDGDCVSDFDTHEFGDHRFT